MRHHSGNYHGTSPLFRWMQNTAFALLFSLCWGCGTQEYDTVPVSGRVTLNGEPLANVGLMFVLLAEGQREPNIGPGSLGRTDADGVFHLQTVRGESGAIPTTHVVRLSLNEQSDASDTNADYTPEGTIKRSVTRPTVRLPARASDGTLRCEVPPEGTDQANFDLHSS